MCRIKCLYLSVFPCLLYPIEIYSSATGFNGMIVRKNCTSACGLSASTISHAEDGTICAFYVAYLVGENLDGVTLDDIAPVGCTESEVE